MDSRGDRIKKLRKDQGLTQSQLGDILGVTGKAVHNWGKDRSIDIDNLRRLAGYFGVSMCDIDPTVNDNTRPKTKSDGVKIYNLKDVTSHRCEASRQIKPLVFGLLIVGLNAILTCLFHQLVYCLPISVLILCICTRQKLSEQGLIDLQKLHSGEYVLDAEAQEQLRRLQKISKTVSGE